MWLDLALVSTFTLACLVFVLVDSKKPTHGCTREQATRVTNQTTK